MSAAQEDYLSYKAGLFSDERMKMREYFFEKYLLASLDAAYKNSTSDVDFHVLIMASTELPRKNKKFLEQKVKDYEWLHVSYLSPDAVDYGYQMKLFLDAHYPEQQLICATARLDDDDALFKDYINVLSKYLDTESENTVISFSLGYNLYIDLDGFNIVGASECYHSKIALGLAYIRTYSNSREVVDDNIYKCGNHIKIDKNYRVVDYKEKHAFIRVNTILSDRMYLVDKELRSKRLNIEYRKQGDKRVGLGRAKKSFPFLPI